MILAGLLVFVTLATIMGSAIGRGKQGTDALTEEQYVARMTNKLASLQRDAATRPDDTNAINAVADMLFYLERFAEAEREYLKSLSINPDQPIVWSLVGEARVKMMPDQGVPPAALDAFAQALSRNPKDDRARYYLAINYANTGRADLAMAIFRDLSASAPPESISKTAAERAILELEARR